MATSPVPTENTTRGMSFLPSNGVAARERIEANIRETARQRKEEQSFKRNRTSASPNAWGKGR